MQYRLVVFDFDGTLVDASAPIVASMNHALAGAGFPERSRDEIWALVGMSLPRVLDRLTGGACDAEALAALQETYKARFSEIALGTTRLFDGVPELVAELAAAGHELAIATNRGRASLEEILDAHGLADAFGFLVGGYCVAKPKPDPEMLERALAHFGRAPADALVVGDTVHDLQMARAAGVDACAVTWGAHAADALAAEGPAHVVHSTAELATLLR